MKKKISKANKPNKPNVYLSDRTKRHVQAKTYYVHRDYDSAVRTLCNEFWKLYRENEHLKQKTQALMDALKSLVETVECCQECNK